MTSNRSRSSVRRPPAGAVVVFVGVTLAMNCGTVAHNALAGDASGVRTPYSLLDSPGFFPPLENGFEARSRRDLTIHITVTESVPRDATGPEDRFMDDPEIWSVPVVQCIPALMRGALAGEAGIFAEVVKSPALADLRLAIDVREFSGELIPPAEATSEPGTDAEDAAEDEEPRAHGRCRLLATLEDPAGTSLIAKEYVAERTNEDGIATDRLRNASLALRACLLDVLRDIDRLVE